MTTHLIYNVDCLDFMQNKMDSNTIDLIITDPPFNIGKKYGGIYKDNKTDKEYFDWCKSWLTECIRLLKDTGSLYLFNYPERNAYLLPFLEQHMIFKRWLTWHFPTNTGHSKTNYTRTQYSIIFCTKGPKATFNREEIAEPYKNPTDKRVQQRIINGSKGRAPYDVFHFNLVKNVSKEKTSHPCQIPESLLEIFIKASSNKGDMVFDPFGGSFSTSVAAKRLERNSISTEINPEYVKIGEERLAI